MSGTDEEVVARAHGRLGSVLRGKYRLDRVLGIGGMATVYAATHRNGNEFAVKVLHPELSTRSEIRNRFLREGHATSAVKHPGVVQVLDDDVAEDGSAFLVMELLHGDSIEALWERRHHKLPLRLVVGIGLQILAVLEAAHARGVIHRDIKPANAFLTGAGVVKVLDFGIARIRDMAASQATQTGMMLGTPAFMAPEQALANTGDIDARTDVWAVGATLFTLASGKLVHEADNAQQIMIRAATTPAPPFSRALPDAPPLIAEIIDRALAFDRGERWESASAMRSALATASRSALGDAASSDKLAEILEELGEEATVVQTAYDPEARSALAGPSGGATTTPSAKETSKPDVTLRIPGAQALGVPAPGRALSAELATAKPVSRDASRKPRRRLRGPEILVVSAIGFAAAIAGAVALLPSRRHASSWSAASTSESTATAIDEATSAERPIPSASAPIPSVIPDQTALSAPPTESVHEVAIDELPTARPAIITAPRTPRLPAPTATTQVPMARPNCNPPYTIDEQGNRKVKRECLR